MLERIHMIPLMPFSTLTRSASFVTEEWNTYFADGQVDQAQNVVGGWKGILWGYLSSRHDDNFHANEMTPDMPISPL